LLVLSLGKEQTRKIFGLEIFGKVNFRPKLPFLILIFKFWYFKQFFHINTPPFYYKIKPMDSKIIKSQRRRRTASAQLKNGFLEIRLPAWVSFAEELAHLLVQTYSKNSGKLPTAIL